MAYCTVADVKAYCDSVNQLADDATGKDAETAGDATLPTITELIQDADSFIDSKIGKAYAVPLAAATLPKIIRGYSARLAAYYLQSRREFVKKEMGQKDDLDFITAELEKIGNGESVLPGITPGTAKSTGHFSADSRQFTRSKMQDF